MSHVHMPERSPAFHRLTAHEEVARDAHQRDHRKVLIDRCNTCIECVARPVEQPRFAIDQEFTGRRLMHAGKGIDQRRSVLDDLIATSEASAAGPSPDEVPPPEPRPTPLRATPRPASTAYMPVLPTWGHGFHPSVTAPAPAPPPSGLRVDTTPSVVLGSKIKTHRSIDPARRAQNMKTGRFDLAGLANTDYHIGDFGVDTLTELIISNCGYQTFHVDHPEDVLLCFQEIINIHCVVVQTWTNTRTHFSGPVVEYILEKALPVFPHLLDLDVSAMVKFYDGLQKISMRYLLPLMPFDSIRLAFGYEGLCPPGLGTTRYSAIASAWMDVLPCLLPQKESLVESTIFSVSVVTLHVCVLSMLAALDILH